MHSFVTCTSRQILLGRSDRGENDGQGTWFVLGTRKMFTAFWWEALDEREH